MKSQNYEIRYYLIYSGTAFLRNEVFEISTTEYSNRDFEIYNMKEQIKKFLNEEQDPKA
jgi:hypothetical protein